MLYDQGMQTSCCLWTISHRPDVKPDDDTYAHLIFMYLRLACMLLTDSAKHIYGTIHSEPLALRLVGCGMDLPWSAMMRSSTYLCSGM